MRKPFIIAAILSSPAIAHQVQPQTQFFQEELKRNPLTDTVLAWCDLRGLDEIRCKQEMYPDGSLHEGRTQAAAKCIDASGLKARVNLDKHFKVDYEKEAQLGHTVAGARWHQKYVADKNDGTSTAPHRHFYTDIDLKEAANFKGDEYVDRLKRDHAKDSVTETTSLSGTGTLGASGVVVHGEGSVTKGSETSVTKAPLTEQQIAEARRLGEEYGRAHPETTSVVPSGVCYKGGDCITPTQVYPNPDSSGREGVATSTNPKPEKGPEVKEKDPFVPTSKDSDLTKPEKKDKGVSTPVEHPEFLDDMAECVEHELYEMAKDEGQKTKDPNAESDEEKKARAELQLQEGYCDESYWGVPFCQQWKHELTKTSSSTAEADAQAAYNQAMWEFQNCAGCNEMILGFEFCHQARVDLDSHGKDTSEEDFSIQPGEGVPAPVNPVDPGPEPMSGTDGAAAPSCPDWNANCGS